VDAALRRSGKGHAAGAAARGGRVRLPLPLRRELQLGQQLQQAVGLHHVVRVRRLAQRQRPAERQAAAGADLARQALDVAGVCERAQVLLQVLHGGVRRLRGVAAAQERR
jgi:hypothetical protein